MNEKEIASIVKTIVDQYKSGKDVKMTLDLALALTDKVKEKAKMMGIKAVIAVSDAGGNVISVQSMDDAYIASYDIAVNKAFTVVSLKMPTKDLKTLAAPGGELYGIQFTNDGKIVIFGGGVPLTDKEGKIIGGLGVSGGTEVQDTKLGDYGEEIFKTLL